MFRLWKSRRGEASYTRRRHAAAAHPFARFARNAKMAPVIGLAALLAGKPVSTFSQPL